MKNERTLVCRSNLELSLLQGITEFSLSSQQTTAQQNRMHPYWPILVSYFQHLSHLHVLAYAQGSMYVQMATRLLTGGVLVLELAACSILFDAKSEKARQIRTHQTTRRRSACGCMIGFSNEHAHGPSLLSPP